MGRGGGGGGGRDVKYSPLKFTKQPPRDVKATNWTWFKCCCNFYW